MKMEERQKFKTWYKGKINCNAKFCFRTEIEEYRRSDVEILRRACGKFQSLFIDLCEFDSFIEPCPRQRQKYGVKILCHQTL